MSALALFAFAVLFVVLGFLLYGSRSRVASGEAPKADRLAFWLFQLAGALFLGAAVVRFGQGQLV